MNYSLSMFTNGPKNLLSGSTYTKRRFQELNRNKNLCLNYILLQILRNNILMSKSKTQFTGRLAGFDPSAYANEFVSVDEVLEIKKSFDLFDYDGGGSIDPRELKASINSLGIEAKAEAVWHMIAEIDKDGSGQLEFDEFFTMMTTRPSENESREEIHKVFVTFDLGRTGYIALKDLRKVAKDLGELTDDNVLQEMVERADFDQDGLVSEEEFYNLVTKKA